MARESCAICGEETDEDILDEHGHLAASDDETCWLCGETEEDHSDEDHEFELAN